MDPFRQKKINPRAKTNHANPFSSLNLLSGANPGDNLSSQYPGDLSNKNVTGTSLQVNQGLSVPLRGFCLPSHPKPPTPWKDLLHPTGARSPVNVNVQKGEEDADLGPLLSVHRRSNPDHPSIRWGEDSPSLSRRKPLWVSEEEPNPNGKPHQEKAARAEAHGPEKKGASQEREDKRPSFRCHRKLAPPSLHSQRQ
jgi:hypothetical protein